MYCAATAKYPTPPIENCKVSNYFLGFMKQRKNVVGCVKKQVICGTAEDPDVAHPSRIGVRKGKLQWQELCLVQNTPFITGNGGMSAD